MLWKLNGPTNRQYGNDYNSFYNSQFTQFNSSTQQFIPQPRLVLRVIYCGCHPSIIWPRSYGLQTHFLTQLAAAALHFKRFKVIQIVLINYILFFKFFAFTCAAHRNGLYKLYIIILFYLLFYIIPNSLVQPKIIQVNPCANCACAWNSVRDCS